MTAKWRFVLLGVSYWLLGWQQGLWAQETETPPRDVIYVMEADGTGWRKFFELPQITKLGSPGVSPNGKYLAFDGWMPLQGERTGDARLFVVATDGSEFWILGNGAMPTWGPDSRQVACSFYTGPRVGILTIANLSMEPVHSEGWGAQWSPDGALIAYTLGAELWVYDVAKKSSRMVYDGSGEYDTIYWNATWSPNSQQILFCGGRDDSREIASIRVTSGGPDLKKHVVGRNPAQKYAWHPTEPRVIFPMVSEEHGRMQLWEFDPTQEKVTPTLVRGQDHQTAVESATWSSDGKLLYCTGRWRLQQ